MAKKLNMVPGTPGAADLCPEAPVRPSLPAGTNRWERRPGCAATAGGDQQPSH